MIDKDRLRRERHLSDEDLREVIGRAARLQRESRDARHANVDIAEVAGELDIAPEYVDQALASWQRDREAQTARDAARAARRRVVTRYAGMGLIGIGVLTMGGAWFQGRSMNASAQTLEAAESRLLGALVRQAELVPALIALSGGDPAALQTAARAVRQSPTVGERLAAATVFDDAATIALTKLPPASDASAEQRRLSLEHELTGARNRITVERGRYEVAKQAVARSRQGWLARLATMCGWG